MVYVCTGSRPMCVCVCACPEPVLLARAVRTTRHAYSTECVRAWSTRARAPCVGLGARGGLPCTSMRRAAWLSAPTLPAGRPASPCTTSPKRAGPAHVRAGVRPPRTTPRVVRGWPRRPSACAARRGAVAVRAETCPFGGHAHTSSLMGSACPALPRRAPRWLGPCRALPSPPPSLAGRGACPRVPSRRPLTPARARRVNANGDTHN